MKVSVGENSEYVNLGDWITYFTYGVFDGETFENKKYELIHWDKYHEKSR
jgi:UDP-2,3-diacylglucosamine hydrolase